MRSALHRRLLAVAAFALVGLAGQPAQAQATGQTPPWLSSAYKDVTLHADPAAPRITAQWRPAAPVALPDARLHGRSLVWAFATGECGQETWGPFDTDRFAALNVAAFTAAGSGYTISTGGEAGSFTCASDEGMARFLARYDSPQLQGIDFDLERQQTPAQVDALAQRMAWLQRQRPALRLSVTLATHAASDGTQRSLNALGETVLAALRRHGVDRAIVNLMVMNYGPADARWCVLANVPAGAPARCDMGASALQAARHVHAKYGVPLAQIALTPMPGLNDVRGNVFTLADARVLANGARALGLAGVHHWSLDRDQPCAGDAAVVDSGCHGLPAAQAGEPGAFGRALAGQR